MSAPHDASRPAADGAVTVDTSERGAPRDGAAQQLDRRLFFQLLVLHHHGELGFDDAARQLVGALEARGASTVVYDDVNDPRGLGVLSLSEDPSDFVAKTRPALGSLHGFTVRHDFSMLGRTYSSGYEQDLAFWLLDRPRATVANPAWPWAIWYPLRRIGAFERLDAREKGGIMREHGDIGKAYGAADLAHDVRLACHGLDPHDNDFVIGLIGKELHPLSHVVQAMRKTRQTAEFMQEMGPFFVGRVRARTALG